MSKRKYAVTPIGDNWHAWTWDLETPTVWGPEKPSAQEALLALLDIIQRQHKEEP